MRKIILQEFLTLDGFAADQDGKTSFFDFLKGEGGKEVDEDLLHFISTIDTILLGAETYRLFVNYWPTPASKGEIVAEPLNATPKVVFSQTLNRAPWGEWEEASIVKTNAAEEITRLKKMPGKDIVVWGSIMLAQSLMQEGLIDEYQLRICPVVLGKGRRLFPDDINPLDMKLIYTKSYTSGLVLLSYQPIRK